VFVSTGDVDGNGSGDIITGAGAGGGPHVKVFFDITGNLSLLHSFFAYDPNFRGGVSVGAGDINAFNGEGTADIITGAGPGGGPHVKVFDGTSLATLTSFNAFDPGFRGGVNVAGLPDVLGGVGIVTAVASNGPPDVRVYLSQGQGHVAGVFAYDQAFQGGVNVGVAPVGPNGEFAILTGAGPGGGPHVKAFVPSFSGPATTVLSFFAFDPAFMGGVYVG
jgi:hypothetical protein